jgi:hypothetical protein
LLTLLELLLLRQSLFLTKPLPVLVATTLPVLLDTTARPLSPSSDRELQISREALQDTKNIPVRSIIENDLKCKLKTETPLRRLIDGKDDH